MREPFSDDGLIRPFSKTFLQLFTFQFQDFLNTLQRGRSFWRINGTRKYYAVLFLDQRTSGFSFLPLTLSKV